MLEPKKHSCEKFLDFESSLCAACGVLTSTTILIWLPH